MTMLTAVTTVHTERLVLRAWRDDDREAFAAMNADARVMEHFPAVLSRSESDQLVNRFREHWAARGFGLWAVELAGEAPFIGFVGLSTPRFTAHFSPCVEVGWRLAAAYWGRGLATESAEAAVRVGCVELDLNEIVSFTVANNIRSTRVMQKLGMHRDAHDDFDHPGVALNHPLRRHVLYRLRRDVSANR